VMIYFILYSILKNEYLYYSRLIINKLPEYYDNNLGNKQVGINRDYHLLLVGLALVTIIYVSVKQHFSFLLGYSVLTFFFSAFYEISLDTEIKHGGFLFSTVLFFPYIIYIIKDVIIGKKIDITNQLITTENNTFSETVENLKSLKDANIISEEQYNHKVSQSRQEKKRNEFMLTKEYQTLLNLKKQGIFSEEEFEKKVEEVSAWK